MSPVNRDLAQTDLWHESLERSVRRRELAELARKHQSRQKSASLAVTAAMATTPLAPTLSLFTNGGSSKKASHHRVEAQDDGSRVLLERGISSDAVKEVQQRLKVDEDGIFGPITEAAVQKFQTRHHLPATGKVDVRTWLTLFPHGMIVYDPHNATAQLAAHAPQNARMQAIGAAGSPAADAGLAQQGGAPADA